LGLLGAAVSGVFSFQSSDKTGKEKASADYADYADFKEEEKGKEKIIYMDGPDKDGEVLGFRLADVSEVEGGGELWIVGMVFC